MRRDRNEHGGGLMLYARPPDSNLDGFFANLSVSLNQALDRYDNVIVIGDINIDTQDSQHPGYNKMVSFCDVFGLSNLVTTKTCFTNSHSSSIDVILTNKPRTFLKTSIFETQGGYFITFNTGRSMPIFRV